MTGAISRNIPMPTRLATYCCAWNHFSGIEPTNARTSPMRKLISEIIGSAFGPHSVSWCLKSHHRICVRHPRSRPIETVNSPVKRRISRIVSFSSTPNAPKHWRRVFLGGAAFAAADVAFRLALHIWRSLESPLGRSPSFSANPLASASA